jgi:hypothetical protein
MKRFAIVAMAFQVGRGRTFGGHPPVTIFMDGFTRNY